MIEVVLNESDSQFPILLENINSHKRRSRLTKKAAIELRNNLDKVISNLDKPKIINKLSDLGKDLGFNETELKDIEASIEDHSFSRFLTLLRVKKNYTQVDVVIGSRLSLKDVTTLEHAKNNNIDINNCIEYLRVLGLEIDSNIIVALIEKSIKERILK